MKGGKWWTEEARAERRKEKKAKEAPILTQSQKDDYEAWRLKFEEEDAAAKAKVGGVANSGGAYR